MSVRKMRDALVLVGAFIALIWVLQVFNWADGYRLDLHFGILSRDLNRLPEIFTAPFLHFSWQHIEGNTVPLFVLGVLAAYRGIGKFLLVTFIIAVVSGLAVWLFQSGNELTVGASGLIFGYFGYVLIRGFFDRNLLDIGVGVVAGLLYWTILQVAIPGTPGISWIGHLGGLVGGVLAAWLLRAPTPAGVTAGGWTSGLGDGRVGGGDRTGGGPTGGDPTGGGGSGGAGGRAGGTRWGGLGRVGLGRGSLGRGGAGGHEEQPGRGTPRPGRPGGTGSASPGGHPGSKAAADLLRELDDMGL